MNYIHNTPQDNCQLNDVNKKMDSAALKYRKGAKYYDLVREYTIVSTVVELVLFLTAHSF